MTETVAADSRATNTTMRISHLLSTYFTLTTISTVMHLLHLSSIEISVYPLQSQDFHKVLVQVCL